MYDGRASLPKLVLNPKQAKNLVLVFTELLRGNLLQFGRQAKDLVPVFITWQSFSIKTCFKRSQAKDLVLVLQSVFILKAAIKVHTNYTNINFTIYTSENLWVNLILYFFYTNLLRDSFVSLHECQYPWVLKRIQKDLRDLFKSLRF